MEESPGAETYLTVAEVAELLKLNQQTVRNWIDAGSLPALRVGRRVRIRRSDFERVLEEGSTLAGPPTGPSAVEFWSGTPVGAAELDPDASARQSAAMGEADPDAPARPSAARAAADADAPGQPSAAIAQPAGESNGSDGSNAPADPPHEPPRGG